MGPYDQRHVTLDPGLTALALRGLHERDGHYPFIERFRRRRHTRRRPRRTPAAAAAFLPRSAPAESGSLWQTLFGRRRVEAPRHSSSAAA